MTRTKYIINKLLLRHSTFSLLARDVQKTHPNLNCHLYLIILLTELKNRKQHYISEYIKRKIIVKVQFHYQHCVKKMQKQSL